MLVITVPQNGTRLCLRVRGNNKHYLISSKEGRTPKNWCLRTVVLEKAPESPSDSKTKPINLKGDQTRIFTEKTDAEAPVLAPWCQELARWKRPAGRRKKGRQRTRRLDGFSHSMEMSLSKVRRWWRTRKPGVLESMESQTVGHDCDWTTEFLV